MSLEVILSIFLLLARVSLSSRRLTTLAASTSGINKFGASFELDTISRKDDFLISIEYYGCEDSSQSTVTNHLNKFTLKEYDLLRDFCTFSTLLSSIDKRRVVHVIGWDVRESLMQNVDIRFDKFRDKAANAPDTCVSMQDSTHLYETLYSFPKTESAQNLIKEEVNFVSADIFSCRSKDANGRLISQLINSVQQIETVGSDPRLIENMVSIHVLSAIDTSVCVLLGIWKDDLGYEKMHNFPEFQKQLTAAKAIAAEGTFCDIVEKSSSRRLFAPSTIFHSEAKDTRRNSK